MNNNSKRRKKQWLRIRLGILQMIYNPVLNVLLLPILFLTILLWMKKDWLLNMFDVFAILLPVWKYSIDFCLILFPIMLLVIMIESIGSLAAVKDEEKLQKAFEEYDLRNGCPTLVNKKRIKNTDVIMREFYSEIDIETWKRREKQILHQFNAHYSKEVENGGKDNNNRKIIRTYMAPGAKSKNRGEAYDEEL